jgi:hypothetical protein
LGGYFTFTIWDLGFNTSIDRLTELTKILKKSPVASLASPFPHPQNLRHRHKDLLN